MSFPDDIILSGISGRYPSCSSLEALKVALLAGEDLVSEHQRWPVYNTPKRMGTVPELDLFDATFFDMNPNQANSSDPRLRKLLEVVFEAIVDAGVNPRELRGTKTGVFLALSQTYQEMAHNESTIFARSAAITANTISFAFDFKGPSYALDSACSTSLYAMDHAVNALRNGDCDTAVVCAAQLHLDSHDTEQFTKMKILNLDGKCKAFQEDRDGYVKGEAIVALLIQKKDVVRRIYCGIAATGTNVDGWKDVGINHPAVQTQKELLEDLYQKHNIPSEEVFYVEAHGTGTRVGDTAEAQSLAEFFGKPERKQPLYVGSVKSNLGHCETASALVSVSKAIVTIQSGQIPRNCNYQNPAKDIPSLVDGTLQVLKENKPYEGGFLGINAFGFGGANGHVVLRPYTERNYPQNPQEHRIVQISGRTEEAVQVLADKVIEHRTSSDFLALLDNVFHFPIDKHYYRGYVLLSSAKDQSAIVKTMKQSPKLWFVYPGMGSQWPGMGRDLMKIPVFRDTVKKCSDALKPYGVDLENVLLNGTEKTYENSFNCFTAITAVSVALTDVLRSMGLEPDGITGHSLGEAACAYADGLLTAEEAVFTAYARAYAVYHTTQVPGLMAAVGLSAEECQKRLPEDIFIACYNSSDNVTITGPEDSVHSFLQSLTEEGVFNRVVPTGNVAFHSKYVEKAGIKLLEFLKSVIVNPKRRTKRWISSSYPENEWGIASEKFNCAEYHHHNFVSPVYFEQVFKHIPEDAVVVEVGPRGLLQAILKRGLGKDASLFHVVDHRVDDNLDHIYRTLGNVSNAGIQLNLKKFYQSEQFPVGVNTPSIGSLIKWEHNTKYYLPKNDPSSAFGARHVVNMAEEDRYLEGHQVDNQILFPATGYMDLVWKSFSRMLGKSREEVPVVFENVQLLKATVLSEVHNNKFVVNILKSSGEFEVRNDTTILASGSIRSPENIEEEFTVYFEPREKQFSIGHEDFYKELHLRGIDYYGLFQGVVSSDVNGSHSIVKWQQNWVSFMDTIAHHLVLHEQKGLFVATKMNRIVIDPRRMQSLENGTELVISYNRTTGAVKCAGCEIVGLSGAILKRKEETVKPTLRTFGFVPEVTHESSGSGLEIATQIVMENMEKKFDLTIGVVNGDFTEEALVSINSVILESDLSKTKISKFDSNATLSSQFDLLVTMTKTQQSLEEIVKFSKNSDFIFGNVAEYSEDILNNFGLASIYTHKTDLYNFVLFRRTRKLPEEYAIIIAHNSSYDWVEQLKEAINTHQNPDSRIYLVSSESQCGIVGFFACIRKEEACPNLRIVFVPESTTEKFSLKSKFYSTQLVKDLTMNVFETTWGTYRLIPYQPVTRVPLEEVALVNGRAGTEWMQKNCSEKDEVSVHFAAYNSWDGNSGDVGTEWSGVDGSGNRVMGVVPSGAISTRIQPHAQLTWKVPSEWSLEEAATIPVAYLLSYYTLFVRNKLSPDSVLVNNGTSGTSIAAISLLLQEECSIFVTVSKISEKMLLLRIFPKLKQDNIFILSEPFASMIMKRRKGKGVSLVLNCEEDLPKGVLKCVSKNHTLLDLNPKTTLWKILEEPQDILEDTANQINKLIDLGVITPLPYETVNVEDATPPFKLDSISKLLIRMTQSKKVLATLRPKISPEKSYIIIGGFGGLGLELAKWLITKGALKVVLNSRRQVRSGYEALCIEKFKTAGVLVHIDTSDSSTFEGASALLNAASTLGPIGGIFNSALVLNDAPILQQTPETFQGACRPKIDNTHYLDILSRKLPIQLDYFVAFSSIVTSMGSPTQSNYAYANFALERICMERRRDGLHGLSIEWGPIGDVGFFAKMNTKIKLLDAAPQSIQSCLDVLEKVLDQTESVIVSCVYSDSKEEDVGKQRSAVEAVLSLFGIKDVSQVDDGFTLMNLGIDSLLAFEVHHLLEQKYDVDMGVDQIKKITVGDLKQIKM